MARKGEKLSIAELFKREDLQECVILGPRHGLNVICVLLGCYAAYIGSCLPKFRDRLSVPLSWAGTLKMKPISYPEMPVNKHQFMLRNIPEKRKFHMQKFCVDVSIILKLILKKNNDGNVDLIFMNQGQ